MKKNPCVNCSHSFTQHQGGEGCWAQGGKPWELCNCLVYSDLVVEETPRYERSEGEVLKEAGQQRALDAARSWKEMFADEVKLLARSGRVFTSEDVLVNVGLPTGEVEMNGNNAVGAMMTSLAKKGVIRKTGARVMAVRPSSHGAELTEWQGIPTSTLDRDGGWD